MQTLKKISLIFIACKRVTYYYFFEEFFLLRLSKENFSLEEL
ncbi:hypothetical protein G5S_0638 [Chlamydia pecorum E58]|uniref:Uncharacterized protein n=1 Tax=Chlamydia pecorum (strain ATCC VR-628 / DSM 29919 / E58) TaxID=331635 RepID=A0AA34WHZ6_CHLPE|nr:hypothetical protein G5S_0638 [Chlamydia pecorum E58]